MSQSKIFFQGIPNYKETRGWFCYNNHFGGVYGTTVDKIGAHDLAVMEFEWPLSEFILLNTNNGGYSDGEKTFITNSVIGIGVHVNACSSCLMKTSVLNDTWWENTASNGRVTLKLNTPVARVNVTTPQDPASQVQVEVVDKSGVNYHADHVIVTVAIGVLKESIKDVGGEGIKFSPELPAATVSVELPTSGIIWICNFRTHVDHTICL